MKRIAILSLSLLLTVAAFAQVHINDANAEVRKVGSFHGIKASHGIEVLLTQSNSEAVAVSAAEIEHRDRIKTVVENGILKIYYDQDFIKQLRGKDKKLKAYVSVVNLDKLDGSSGAMIRVEGELKVARLDVDMSSGSQMQGKVHVNQLEIDQSSGSIVKLSGTANNVVVDGSSGSIFNGSDLLADNCTVDGSSGSNIEVNVSKELNVSASSGSNISYKGAGGIKNVKTSSGGNVSRRG